MPHPDNPADLLRRALRADPARPFVTYHDVASGGRVELSVATFANWVDKTAGLLRDELDVDPILNPATTVSLVLPAHWLGLVWAQAAWTAGARLALGPVPQPAVSVRPVPRLDTEPHEADATNVVVVGTTPLGGAAGAEVPPGALDYGREVLGQPDHFDAMATPDDPGLEALLRSARERATLLEPHSRILVVAAHVDAAVVRDGLLVPLLTDSAVVLVTGAATDDQVAAISAQERARGLPD